MKYKLIMLLTILLCVEVANAKVCCRNVENVNSLRQIRLTGHRGGVDGEGNTPHCAPMRPVIIGYSDHVLFLQGRFGNAEVEVRQEGNVVFSAYVETGTDQVVLPSSLEGECELIIHAADGIYTGWLYIDMEKGEDY